MALTLREQRFVEEYLISPNVGPAMIRAGYSPNSARQHGHQVMKRPDIIAAIAAGQAKLSAKTGITAERVLNELAKIAFADIRKVFTPSGNLLPPADMDDDTAAIIASIDVVTRSRQGGASEGLEDQPNGGALKRRASQVEHIHKIKLADKLGALTQIGRHLGMFTDRIDANIKGDVQVTIKRFTPPPSGD